MYLAHWGLHDAPFRSTLDPRSFFESPTHEEALARLHFLIDGGRRAGLLLGGPGSGKSLLLEVFARMLAPHGWDVARIGLVGLDKMEFLHRLAGAWGLFPAATASPAELWRLLLDRLAAQHVEQRKCLVLLDDCDEAEAQVLCQALRLAQTDVGHQAAVTLVLSARTSQVSRLGERLLEVADLRIDLNPWGRDDTQRFLENALARSGRTAPTFNAEAISLLAEISQGVPRNVVQLADLALIAAAGRELREVDAATVESVFAELGVVQQFDQQFVNLR